MIATLLSLGLAALFAFYYQTIPSSLFPIVALAVGILILLITPLIKGLTYLPLQAASVEISSRSLQYARKDLTLKMLSLVWILFGLFSIVVSAYASSTLFYVWLIWLGLSLDAIYWFIHRVTGYCDPHEVVDTLQKQGLDAAGVIGGEKSLMEAVDGLGEVGLKAILQRGTALAEHAMTALEGLAEGIVTSISEEKKKGIITEDEGRDRVSYRLSYLFQRLQMIFQQAADEGLEAVASKSLVSASKMVLATAKLSPEAASLPYHFFNRFLEYAEERDLKEVGLTGSILFQQLARELMDQNEPVSGILFQLIEKMEQEAKDRFKENKQTAISVLIQPFEELKRFMEEKPAAFPDSDLVHRELDRVIGEFLALQEVLRTVPNIPGYSTQD